MWFGTVLLSSCVLAISAAVATPRCHALHDPDVKSFDIRLPLTSVPADLTTYVCRNFEIPLVLDQSYHAVAFEPIIANPNIMHHMILFGCPNRPSSVASHQCGSTDNLCRTFLVQWSMGIEGPICSPPNTGVRFGLDSLQSMALQIHWNNANRSSGLEDSSGIRVYYTKKTKHFDIGNVQVGQNDLEIPAHQHHHEQSGSCSAGCTSQWLKQPIYLTRGHIHMHYLGSGGVLEVLRDGKVVSEALRDNGFNYNKPSVHELTRPVEVRPGDELRLTCFFNSKDGQKSRNRTLFWGEGSNGEMCYAFITYFPNVQDFDQCIQFDRYDICSAPGQPAPLGQCYFGGFVRQYQSGISQEILNKCQLTQHNEDKEPNISIDLLHRQQRGVSQLCSQECQLSISELTDHPCMQDRLGKQAERVYLSPIPSWKQVKTIIDQSKLLCKRS